MYCKVLEIVCLHSSHHSGIFWLWPRDEHMTIQAKPKKKVHGRKQKGNDELIF